ncbi:MAG: WecB/TagA/CpsF family glycosyltransferase [Oscillospiraceae bacterium]|jgi:N-acetylglucosaminyldiphosphoundecaprenol N-acetyl-beta-D-mannosaminyltransferase|nr:WecB/TagA/CpsF family glycosyltransferase [Oscillospiraceae bacterium]
MDTGGAMWYNTRMRTDVLGVGFDDTTVAEAAKRAAEMIFRGERGYVVTPNPEIVWMCRKNAELKEAVNGAALVLADGVGVTLGARILGRPLKARAPGIDFIEALFGLMSSEGGRVFLLGAKPGVAEAAAENLRRRYPGLVVAGLRDGYFGVGDDVTGSINAAAPDLLVVCLGAPKQELWMAENAPRLNAALCVGLGGALDVFAGAVKRAPALWRRLGLEWLYRLISNPGRLKRMSILPLYLLAVIRSGLGGGDGR